MKFMRVTLRAVNDEIERHGYKARLAKASGYYFFEGGEADEWLDKTVNVPTISSLSLPEGVLEVERLKKLNGEIMRGKGRKQAPKRKPEATT
jgi:hypothetical protein